MGLNLEFYTHVNELYYSLLIKACSTLSLLRKCQLSGSLFSPMAGQNNNFTSFNHEEASE